MPSYEALKLAAAASEERTRAAEEELRWTEQFYRTLVETTNTGYVVHDPNGFVIDANAEYARLTGRFTAEELPGHNLLEWIAPHDLERGHAEMLRCLEIGGCVRNLDIDFTDAQGRITPVEVNATMIQTPEGPRLLALCRDITERRQAREAIHAAQEALEIRVRERTTELAHANAQIRARAHHQEAVAAFGWRALTGVDIDALMREGAELVGRTLGVEFVKLLEQTLPKADDPPLQNDMVVRSVLGLPQEWIGQAVSSSREGTLSSYVLSLREPVIIADLATDRRFKQPLRMQELGVVSGVAVIIAGSGRPFGLMIACTRRRRAFNPDDVNFFQSIANVLAEAIERKRTEAALNQAKEEAEKANLAKSEFLSRMSHELRTPLNAILGFGQLLEIENLEGSQRESVEQIVRAGRHLLGMVNEVLDIARIESGNLLLAPETVNINLLLREAADLIRPLADARQIELVLPPKSECSGRHALADRQRLRQSVLNLLSNAVKYNRRGGRVTFREGLSADGQRLRIEIADTGLGIAPDKLSKLFTPFERLGAEKTAVEGSGIGLALSKRLVEAQGGRIGVESVEGQGSTFWVEIPIGVDPQPVPFPAEFIESFLGAAAPAAQTGVGAESPAGEFKVLYIEDNASNRLLVELLVEQRPAVKLLSANCGEEGLTMAREHCPDLILLDMHLPDMPGEQVLDKLRQEGCTVDTPVVVVSADASAARVRQLREAGAVDYLTKPFNVNQFLRTLDRRLAPAHL
jgi:PAS domain S-box-containing protein